MSQHREDRARNAILPLSELSKINSLRRLFSCFSSSPIIASQVAGSLALTVDRKYIDERLLLTRLLSPDVESSNQKTQREAGVFTNTCDVGHLDRISLIGTGYT